MAGACVELLLNLASSAPSFSINPIRMRIATAHWKVSPPQIGVQFSSPGRGQRKTCGQRHNDMTLLHTGLKVVWRTRTWAPARELTARNFPNGCGNAFHIGH